MVFVCIVKCIQFNTKVILKCPFLHDILTLEDETTTLSCNIRQQCSVAIFVQILSQEKVIEISVKNTLHLTPTVPCKIISRLVKKILNTMYSVRYKQSRKGCTFWMEAWFSLSRNVNCQSKHGYDEITSRILLTCSCCMSHPLCSYVCNHALYVFFLTI